MKCTISELYIDVSRILVLLVICFLMNCVVREGDIQPRLNPLDPFNEINQNNPEPLRRYITVSSTWSDFSFADSTGALRCSLLENFEYVIIYHGEDAKSLQQTALRGVKTFEIDGFKINQPQIFRFTGYFRNGDTLSEIFVDTTPSGVPPSAPETVAGEGTLYGTKIKWKPVQNSASYLIARADSSGSELTLRIATGSEFQDTLSDYRNYYYTVGSTNQYGTARSAYVAAAGKISKIAPPVKCTASQGLYPDHIRLSWKKSSGASGYRIYRADRQDGAFSGISKVVDTFFQDPRNTTGTIYYKVAAIDDSGHTGAAGSVFYGSITDSIDVPSGVVATTGLQNSITVMWNNVKRAQYYKVYRSDDSNGVYVYIDSVNEKFNYYIDSMVTRVVSYYSISAIDSHTIETRKSRYVQGSIQDIPVPAHVSASQGSHLSVITVDWDSVAGVELYYLYRAISAAGPFTCIGSTTVELYGDTVGIDMARYYAVSCRINGIESKKTDPEKGWTITIQTPQNLTASLGTYYSHIALQWQEIGGAYAYVVYRSSTSNGTFEKIVVTTDAHYADSAVPTNEYYYYKVAIMYQDSSIGTPSAYTQGYTNALSYPYDLISLNYHPSKINLKWNKVTGAGYYIVYRSQSSSGTYTAIDTVSDTVYADLLLPLAVYRAYYKVAAGVKTRTGSQSSYVYGQLFSPPSSISLYRQHNGIFLTWSSVNNARKYMIYRSFHDSTSFDFVDSTINYNYSDTTLKTTGTYYYKITACSDSGESRMSSHITVSFVRGPEQLTVSGSNDSVFLRWPKVNGITTWVIYRSEGSDTNFFQYDSTRDTTYNDAFFSRSGDYYYRVQGYVSGGRYYTTASPVGKATVVVRPRAPVSLSTTGGIGYIIVSWSSNSSGSQPQFYIIYRSAALSSATYVPLDTVTTTSYTDSVSDTTYYYYKVSAVNQVGESTLSSYAYGRALAPSAPVPLSASYDVYGSGIRFVWKKASGAALYIVSRAYYSQGSKTVLDTVADTVYTDTLISGSSIYYYSVRSINTTGTVSSYSKELAGKRLGPPSSVSTTGMTDHIYLDWSVASDSSIRYYIYRSSSSAGPFVKFDSTASMFYRDSVTSLGYHYYKISSVNLDESILSPGYGARLTVSSAPLMVSAVSGDVSNVIIVRWRRSSGAQSYKLYRSKSSSFASPVLVATLSDTLYADTVTSDSLYYYKAKAVSLAGESSLSSNTVNGYRAPVNVPPVPNSPNGTTTYSGYIYVRWFRPQGVAIVDGYKLYRSESQTGVYQLIDSTTTLSYYDYVSRTYPDYYWYYITAWNAVGESTPSDTISGTRR